MSRYIKTATEVDAWFARARKDAEDFAAETKAPVIGYAFWQDYSSGFGCMRLGIAGAPSRAAKLKRMISQKQKRGIRAELYEIGGTPNDQSRVQ